MVVTYNLQEHLPDAVRALTAQTLRSIEILVVDDCSTDDTARIVRELISEDDRIRYIRLDENSGGAGGPRNRGIDEAVAPYVFFLDADDVPERHALKNMLLAAEKEEAVVVAGRTERVDMVTGYRSGWYSHLYSERRTINSIADFPDLSHDTNSTSKLYSTQFLRATGLRFNETIHYEDVLFTAELYAAIGRTVILPELVYDWRVYPESIRKSITNQRDSLANLQDRVYVLERVSTVFSSLGDEVRDEFAVKVLRHHARLYLNDTLALNDRVANEILGELRPLIEKQPVDAFEKLFPYERFLYASVLDGDLAGVRSAVLAEREVALSGRFVRSQSGALEWYPSIESATSRHASALARELRTVSDERLVRYPHTLTQHRHQVTSMSQVRSELTMEGFTEDPFGRLADRLAEADVVLRTSSGMEVARVPLSWRVDGGTVQWSCRIERPARMKVRERDRRNYQIDLKLDDGAVSSSPILMIGTGVVSVRDKSLVGRLLGDRWATVDVPFPPAVFGIEQGARGRIVRSAARQVGALVGAPVRRVIDRARAAKRRLTEILSPTGPIGLRVYAGMRRLPVRRNTAFFEAHMGGSVSDSPGAVFRELSSRRPDMDFSWSTPGGRPVDGLDGVSTIRRGSWRYLDALARSQFLVDNQSFPQYFRKRRGQRYLQTWHGIPLKKMGLDEPRNAGEIEQRRILDVSRQWDGLVVPNPYFEQTFVPAFGYRGHLVRYGTPRCDAIVNGDLDVAEIKRRLAIPEISRVVLYAPTFREALRSRARPAPLPFDLERWRASMPSDVVLVLRSHYLNRFSVSPRASGFCLDASGVDDVNELYAIADVLVTDYSSVMFDFALTGRPIVIYAYDNDDYVNRSRGTYFDLRKDGPGTFVEEESDFYDSVRRVLADGAPPEQAVFRDAFAGREDGQAASRSVDFLLGGSQ